MFFTDRKTEQAKRAHRRHQGFGIAGFAFQPRYLRAHIPGDEPPRGFDDRRFLRAEAGEEIGTFAHVAVQPPSMAIAWPLI